MAAHHKARLNRLFGTTGKCLDVAIDHGVFNEYSFLAGLEDIEAAVRELAAAGPDAIQMNYGQAAILQQIPGKHKPALVLRLDTGNPYNGEAHRYLFDVLAAEPDPVLPGVRMDAACVVCNLLLLPGEPELHAQTIRNIARIRPLCEQYGMPLMIEPLVMKANNARGGFQVDGDKQKVVALVRQARELGADVIKADPTDHAEDYHEVIRAARCPVLVRGGGREPVETVLEKAHSFLRQGAQGLVYGRNIFQHPSPARMVAALMGLIHEDWAPAHAAAVYQGS